jgi:hypothetical protein
MDGIKGIKKAPCIEGFLSPYQFLKPQIQKDLGFFLHQLSTVILLIFSMRSFLIKDEVQFSVATLPVS